VSLSYCEPSKPHSDARSYSHDPAIYTQIWLFLLAVIRCHPAAAQPKKPGFPRCTSAPSGFFHAHQRKQRRLRRGTELR
jgi:hypothetical protein